MGLVIEKRTNPTLDAIKAVWSYGINKCNIPNHKLEIFARYFVPQIQALVENEEVRKGYEERKTKQAVLKAQTVNITV